ncbi:MAG: ribonuclease III domain-containing protein [Gammaproteobacteria bacterium]
MSDSHSQLIARTISNSFGYDIKNINYFISALTHKSKSRNNYERMEILGDAVLQLVITDMLFKKYKDSNEGRITVMRQNLVKKFGNRKSCSCD